MTSAGHALPPLIGSSRTVRVRDCVPSTIGNPPSTHPSDSHDAYSDHSDMVQSVKLQVVMHENDSISPGQSSITVTVVGLVMVRVLD